MSSASCAAALQLLGKPARHHYVDHSLHLCILLETIILIILMWRYLFTWLFIRPEAAKEEERKFGVEDSKLPGASALPPAPLPVSAGALPANVFSGELPCM